METIRCHERLFQAIQARDPEEVRLAIQGHYTTVLELRLKKMAVFEPVG